MVKSSEDIRKAFLSYKFAEELVGEGWRTPDCYSNSFASPPKSAGVYLFTVFRIFPRVKSEWPKIAYVGKSRNLFKRFVGHEVYRQLESQYNFTDKDYYFFSTTQRWFKPLDLDQIDQEEINLIKKYNPPFNLQHRTKEMPNV